MHFWTESCGPCRALEKRVFSQPQVAMAIETNYVPVKVNANQTPAVARAYNVTQVPTDVVITPQGDLVKSFISPSSPMDYVSMVSGVAANHRSATAGSFAAATANSPFSSESAPKGQTAVNSAYSALLAQQTAPPAAAQTATANPYVHNTPAASPAVSAGPQAAVQKPAPAANNPPAAPAQAAVAPAPAAQTVANPVAKAAVAPEQNRPAAVQQQAVQQQPVAPLVSSTEPARSERPAQTTAAANLPSGSPPLGFDGYCPVTMRSEWRWAKGDVKWGAIHEGRTYLFASEANRNEFLKSPLKYSPALAGADPVVAVEERRIQPGLREHAVDFEGRFYMFSSEESLNKFWTDAKTYSQGATRVASTLKTDGVIRR